MIEQQGRIASLQGLRATVLLGASVGCPVCAAGRGCGAGVFGRLIARKPMSLELDNPLQLQVGQSVQVAITEAFFMGLLLRLYILPLLAGLAGAALGHYLADRYAMQGWTQDGLALLGAVFLAGLTLLMNPGRRLQHIVKDRVSLLGSSTPVDGQNCRVEMEKRYSE